MLKKWLASAGIGNAKVDTQLDNDQLVPGEEVSGKIVLEGGNAEQQVDQIHLFLMTEAARERNDKKVYEKLKLEAVTVGNSFTIGEGEKKELDFRFKLPLQTPPTVGRTKVWIQTGMDVPNAVDPKDRDFIRVKPHQNMGAVLEALTNELGFRLKSAEMEYSKRYRYVQEFEFSPGHEFKRDLDELEVMFFMREGSIELVLQVDRRAKGLGGLFAEALEMDESFTRVSFTDSEINQGVQTVADKLRNTIRKFS
ncbi:sporulation protein [Lentibacillus sediminis]|uniref:sporulation protein n=1 Tax=Lentibacillus sediminis TaxID=1940529 RepID=UPI000C1BBD25|nr:sporulation protein [Lentibacillus sediminis]